MKILIIDGQGGRIGQNLITQLRQQGVKDEIISLGTNSTATFAMLKAGADAGASGANPVIVNAPTADIIAGPIGIIAANALLGEISPEMAKAIATSPATKVLIPVGRCRLMVAGNTNQKPAESISQAVDLIIRLLSQQAK